MSAPIKPTSLAAGDRYGAGGGDSHARACNRLWASVVVAALSEYWGERQRALRRPATAAMAGACVERAERYFWSRDGRQVLTMAGIDPTERAIAGLVSIVGGDVAPSTLMARDYVSEANGDDASPEPQARRPRRICAVPGCEAVLTASNRTGVCRRHIHAFGCCVCARCSTLVKG